MSVRNFVALLNGAKIGKNDKKWFPLWLRRYASAIHAQDTDLSVTTSEVIKFSQSLRDNGTPAWQRLQAVRAIEAYRNWVLKTEIPSLVEMLGRLADRDKALGTGAGRASVREEREWIGQIDPREPAIVQQMRRELRLRHKAMRTERSYVGWVRRFVGHCRSEKLEQFGEAQIKSFLTDLAVEGNVTSGTQNQAKCALLFLYQVVLQRDLAFLDVARATKPERLPVVLSREEIARLFPEFSGLKRLMFEVMYGAGTAGA